MFAKQKGSSHLGDSTTRSIQPAVYIQNCRPVAGRRSPVLGLPTMLVVPRQQLVGVLQRLLGLLAPKGNEKPFGLPPG